MNPAVAVLAALVGYLLGSISFARILARLLAPGKDITSHVRTVPNTNMVYEDDAVSATLVNLHIGARYGCLTSILDMVKVIAPMLVFRWLAPDQPYYLIVSATAMIGHNWPIYYRFHGGRGESVVYGSMLIIDPLGALVCNVVAALLGVLVGNLHVLRWGGMFLLIPWLWWRTGDTAYLVYIILMNVIFVIAMRDDFREYIAYHKAGAFPNQESLSDFLDMGTGLGQFVDRYSLPALAKKLTGHDG